MSQSNFQLLYTVCMPMFFLIDHMGMIMGIPDQIRVTLNLSLIGMRYIDSVFYFENQFFIYSFIRSYPGIASLTRGIQVYCNLGNSFHFQLHKPNFTFFQTDQGHSCIRSLNHFLYKILIFVCICIPDSSYSPKILRTYHYACGVCFHNAGTS